MEHIGEKIKQARKLKKMTQEKLAELLGVTRVAIANYELNKNNPRHDHVMKIAEILNVSIDELSGKSGKDERSVKFVSIVGTASCGGLEMDFLQERNKKAFYSGEHWKSSLYCVIANGDSMAPEIEDGDEVIIDPDVSCQSGDMVHYIIGNESAIKVLFIDKEANLLQFIPYNQSDDFKTKTIRLDDEDTIKQLQYYKVVSVNKLKFNNRLARLRLINR